MSKNQYTPRSECSGLTKAQLNALSIQRMKKERPEDYAAFLKRRNVTRRIREGRPLEGYEPRLGRPVKAASSVSVVSMVKATPAPIPARIATTDGLQDGNYNLGRMFS